MDFIFNIFGFNSKIGKVSENLCKIIILFFSNPYFKEKKKKKITLKSSFNFKTEILNNKRRINLAKNF